MSTTETRPCFEIPKGYYGRLPQDIEESLLRYFNGRVAPGPFVRAVLENDLTAAWRRADTKSWGELAHIVSLLYNEAPSGSWGSPERVSAWLAGGRSDG